MNEMITVLAKLLFAFIGLFGVVWTAIAFYLAKRSRQSNSWLETGATVLAADVRVNDSGPAYGSTRVGYRITYEPHVTYAYSVGGSNYHNDTYALAAQSAIPDTAGAEAILKDYPVGRNVVVFYDPMNPGDSALVRGGSKGNNLFVVYGVIMIAIGIIGVFFWRRS